MCVCVCSFLWWVPHTKKTSGHTKALTHAHMLINYNMLPGLQLSLMHSFMLVCQPLGKRQHMLQEMFYVQLGIVCWCCWTTVSGRRILLSHFQTLSLMWLPFGCQPTIRTNIKALTAKRNNGRGLDSVTSWVRRTSASQLCALRLFVQMPHKRRKGKRSLPPWWRRMGSYSLASELIGGDKASLTDELLSTAVTELSARADVDTSPRGWVVLSGDAAGRPDPAGHRPTRPDAAHAFWSQGLEGGLFFASGKRNEV